MNVLPLIALSALAQTPTPVVISTDCGCEMDDQWAIIHLCLSPSIDVRAIITAHAPKFTPPRAETSARSAREVVKALPPEKAREVIAGSSEPLIDRKTPQRSKGAVRLLAESYKFSQKNRLTVVQIGPATDVASALLVDATFADRVRVIAMAFDKWPEGDDPFNVKNDVIAWQVLMESRIPLTVVDGAVSLRHLTLTRDQVAKRFGDSGAVGKALAGYQKAWLDRASGLAKSVTGSPDAWPVWDCGTVAVVLGFAKTEEQLRPTLRDDRTFDHSRPNGKINWVTFIDGERLWNDLSKNIPR